MSTRMMAQGVFKDIGKWPTAVISVRSKFFHPVKDRIGPASGVSVDTRVATKVRNDNNRCGRQLASREINASIKSHRGGGMQ